MSEQVERTIAGRYRLTERLGAGGMGTVWRAQDTLLGRDVAIKEVTFPPGVTAPEREVLRERTRREARAAAKLSHPSAVTVYDVVEEDGTPYLVMELVEARTLAEVVRSDGPLSPHDTASLGLAVLGALEGAHRSGIVHRDVKPGNVLLRDDGRVVLTDFGIATSTGDASLTSTGLVLGSPSYISPERARGERPGPASDLWSLGATLFTAVEGRPPYDGAEPLLTLSAVIAGEHAPFVAAGPLAPVLNGLLEKDLSLRYDAARARDGLTQVLETPDTAATTALPAQPAAEGDALRADRTTRLSVGGSHVGVQPEPAAPVPPAREFTPSWADAREAGTRRRRGSLVLAAVLLAALVGLSGYLLSSGLSTGGSGGRATGSAAQPSASPSVRSTGTPATTPRPGAAASRPAAAGPAAGVGAAAGAAGSAGRPAAGKASGGAAAGGPGSTAPSGSPSVPVAGGAGAAGSTGTAADGAGAATGGAVPAGWRTQSNGVWTAAVPPSYQSGSFDGASEFRDPATGRTLRVSTTGPGGGKADPVQDRRDQAASFAARYPSYREISIGPVNYRGLPAADWQFSYSAGGTDLHVLSRVFVDHGRGYSLYFQTPAGDSWDAARADFDRIAAAFRP